MSPPGRPIAPWPKAPKGVGLPGGGAERMHRPRRGGDRGDGPTYPAEHEFRYNHRDGFVPSLLPMGSTDRDSSRASRPGRSPATKN
jgi:hypothetical protein